jgi:hypothetical protein
MSTPQNNEDTIVQAFEYTKGDRLNLATCCESYLSGDLESFDKNFQALTRTVTNPTDGTPLSSESQLSLFWASAALASLLDESAQGWRASGDTAFKQLTAGLDTRESEIINAVLTLLREGNASDGYSAIWVSDTEWLRRVVITLAVASRVYDVDLKDALLD